MKRFYSTLPARYAELCLRPDDRQQLIVKHLDQMLDRLSAPRPWFPFLKKQAVQGVYLYGTVGSGKTMLMDLFYEEASVSKSRVHFNKFMWEVHGRMRNSQNDLGRVASEIGKQRLLCLDELQVTDIADAMILRGLFEGILGAGCFLMLTSNRAPRDLYLNGLQRASFLPAISLLEERLDVLSLCSEQDYRRHEGTTPNYSYASSAELLDLFRQLAPEPKSSILRWSGHEWTLKQTGNGCALLSFADLCCDPPRAATDYLELAHAFKTILISDIPPMHSMRQREEARRFMTLVDILYDAGCRLAIQSVVSISEIFKLAGETALDRVLLDELGAEAAQSSLFTGVEEVFAANRTISRLTQMTSHQWWHR